MFNSTFSTLFQLAINFHRNFNPFKSICTKVFDDSSHRYKIYRWREGSINCGQDTWSGLCWHCYSLTHLNNSMKIGYKETVGGIKDLFQIIKATVQKLTAEINKERIFWIAYKIIVLTIEAGRIYESHYGVYGATMWRCNSKSSSIWLIMIEDAITQLNILTRTCFENALNPKSEILRMPYESSRRFSGCNIWRHITKLAESIHNDTRPNPARNTHPQHRTTLYLPPTSCNTFTTCCVVQLVIMYDKISSQLLSNKRANRKKKKIQGPFY